MPFLVIARDGTDPDATARRAAVRPRHLPYAGALKAAGKLALGGAILDAEGTMRGSYAVYDVADRAELDAILAADPYVTEGVWRDVTVETVAIAVR